MKLLIVDDQRLLRESFKNIVEHNSDIKVVGCAANGKEACDLCGRLSPDVILMDISMPVCSGTEATKIIKARYPDVKILMLTASSDETDISEAIGNGADGYILKDVGAEELILSIKSAAAGLGVIHRDILNAVPRQINPAEGGNQKAKAVKVENTHIHLSERDLRIIELIVDGQDNKQISSALFIAEGTVKNAITEIISKLQLKDRTQLAVFAIKNNLV